MTLPVSNKTKRLSLVGLAGGVITLVAAVLDGVGFSPPASVTAAFTSLVLFLAGFVDWKHADTSDIYTGDDADGG